MGHLTLELILWMLLAFLIGCIIGCLLRKLFAPAAKPVSRPVAASAAVGTAAIGGAVAAKVAAPTAKVTAPVAPVAAPVAAKPAVDDAPAPGTGVPKRPKGESAARGGKADNLQKISGVGPKLERTLHGLGFFHFDQIAKWNRDEVDWVDEHLQFKGRIERDQWIPQARLLAAGDETEFSRRFNNGKRSAVKASPKKNKPGLASLFEPPVKSAAKAKPKTAIKSVAKSGSNLATKSATAAKKTTKPVTKTVAKTTAVAKKATKSSSAAKPGSAVKKAAKAASKSAAQSSGKSFADEKKKSKKDKPRATGKARRPDGLKKPRKGVADNLKRISGVGPKIEKTLHGLGFYHFDQIADWNRDEIKWVDEHLQFKGRIDREKWIKQANLLAKGKETEFSRRFNAGGKNKK